MVQHATLASAATASSKPGCTCLHACALSCNDSSCMKYCCHDSPKSMMCCSKPLLQAPVRPQTPSDRISLYTQAYCGLQVREYEYDPDHQQESQAASQSLQSDAQAKRSQLEEWSATAYGEVGCACCSLPDRSNVYQQYPYAVNTHCLTAHCTGNQFGCSDAMPPQ